MKNLCRSFALILMLSGCATPTGAKLNRVSIGMTKPEVIKVMGEPSSTSAAGTTEVLRYSLDAKRALFSIDFDDYTIELEEGKVSRFGKTGDLEKSADRLH